MKSQLCKAGPASVIVSYSKATKVGHFIRLNPPTITSFMVKKGPQGFADEIEKILHIGHASDSKCLTLLYLG